MSNFEGYQRLKIFLLTIVIIVLAVAVFIVYRAISTSNHPADKKFLIETVEVAGNKLNVNLAANDEERKIGLSETESLADDWGMLFIYQKPEIPSFWMKDMNFPIDIIWIYNGKVVDIERNLSPDNGEATYSPVLKIDAVLEAPAGWIEEKNVIKGDKVEYK